jgi:16S rRNA processing protein RimM
MSQAIGKQEIERARPSYIAVGRVVRPHGVRGGLLVAAISEAIHGLRPDSRAFLGEGRLPITVRFLQPHQNRYLLAADEIKNREQADSHRGAELAVQAGAVTDLPEDTYYHWQIVGLAVETEAGEPLGAVLRILETGANDVYIVGEPGGKELLLPAIQSVIRLVDLEGGRLVVRLLPGLRPEGDA